MNCIVAIVGRGPALEILLCDDGSTMHDLSKAEKAHLQTEHMEAVAYGVSCWVVLMLMLLLHWCRCHMWFVWGQQ